MLPVHGVGPEVLTDPGPYRGNPMIYVRFIITNQTDDTIQVGACTAEALDAEGRYLFTAPPRYMHLHLWLRPGDTFGTSDLVPRYDLGWTAPDGLTLADTQAVDRYDAHCKEYLWIGALPQETGD
jgi:hypothetical protein